MDPDPGGPEIGSYRSGFQIRNTGAKCITVQHPIISFPTCQFYINIRISYFSTNKNFSDLLQIPYRNPFRFLTFLTSGATTATVLLTFVAEDLRYAPKSLYLEPYRLTTKQKTFEE
jgi:hypothetical protein